MNKPKPADTSEPDPAWKWADEAFETLLALAGHARDLHPACRGAAKACGICRSIKRAQGLVSGGGNPFQPRT